MSFTVEQLLEAALGLPPEARASLADQLSKSLELSDSDIQPPGQEANIPKPILLLDDCPRRLRRMRRCLARRFKDRETICFDHAQRMIDYLMTGLPRVALISLDHDLEVRLDADGRLVDFGTGRDVANYLASCRPTCPVIVHSTNSIAAEGMQLVLRETCWRTYRVYPFGDLEWIAARWLPMVAQVLGTANANETD